MSDEIIELINKAKAQAKRDDLLNFLGKNSKVAFKLILILATAGIVWVGFSVYKKSNQEKFAEIFHLSLVDQQTGEFEKAKEKLKKIAEDNSAPRVIILLLW